MKKDDVVLGIVVSFDFVQLFLSEKMRRVIRLKSFSNFSFKFLETRESYATSGLLLRSHVQSARRLVSPRGTVP